MVNPLRKCCASVRLAAFLVSAGVASVPNSALACGASEAPTYTIAEIWPSDGATDIARDSGLLVTLATPSTYLPGGLPVSVRIIDVETGAEASGQVTDWTSSPPIAVWYPSLPLEAGHNYRIEASVVSEGSETEAVLSTFTAGDTLLEPLEFVGDLQVTLEGYDAEEQECMYLCGSADCKTIGERPALRANIQLPAVTGGQQFGGHYIGVVTFADNTPLTLTGPSSPSVKGEAPPVDEHNVFLTQYVRPKPGKRVVIEQEIFEDEGAYAPCFTFEVSDAAGHRLQTSKCLARMTNSEIQALAGSPDTRAAADASAGNAGCALVAHSERRRLWLGVLAAGIGVALLRRRGVDPASARRYLA